MAKGARTSETKARMAEWRMHAPPARTIPAGSRSPSAAGARERPARDHFVGRLSRVEQAAGLLGARHGQRRRIEQSDLDEKRRLIPVDVLVRHATRLVEAHH